MFRKLMQWWNSERQAGEAQGVSPLRRLQAESIAAAARQKERARKLAKQSQRKQTALDDTLRTALGNTISALEAGRAGLLAGAGPAGKILEVADDSEPRLRPARWYSHLIAWIRLRRKQIERRQEPRVAFGCQHRNLQLTLGVCGWPTAVTDVSRTGIGLIVGMWHKPGNTIKIKVVDEERRLIWDVRAKVHRIQPRPDGLWRLGCRFVSRLSDRELAALA
jgi:hypothetical protein